MIASTPLLVTFAAYLLLMVGIGFVAWRSTRSFDDYILGGRSLGSYVTALSAGASDMSGWLLMGLPGAMYLGGLSEGWIAIGLSLFLAGSYVAYLVFGHVEQRVLLWLHPFSAKALDVSDQLVRGLFGMANGGLLGTGLGRGRPDLTYYAESDFIVPSFAEEIGLFGARTSAFEGVSASGNQQCCSWAAVSTPST